MTNITSGIYVSKTGDTITGSLAISNNLDMLGSYITNMSAIIFPDGSSITTGASLHINTDLDLENNTLKGVSTVTFENGTSIDSYDPAPIAGAQGVIYSPDTSASNAYISSTIPGLTFTTDISATGADFTAMPTSADTPDGSDPTELANIDYVQTVSNKLLQAEDVYDVPAAPGVYQSYDYTGTNFYWSTDLTNLTYIGFSDGSSMTTAPQSSDIITKTANYTNLITDYTINCNGTFTNILPNVADASNKFFRIKNIGAGVIYVDGNGVNIDDATMQELTSQYDSIDVGSDGVQYWIY
jgi:hypothetical protein